MPDNFPASFCPYKGLQPYTSDDRAFFFGRDRDQEIIISNLYAAPLTILYGASGVGKSSVLLAGVVPKLIETPRLAVVGFRHWQGENFLTTLKTEVVAAISRRTGKAIDVDVELSFDDLIQECSRFLRGPIFFVLDQFEEYFLYHSGSQVEETFEVEFARAVNRPDLDVNFVLSMREDSLSKLDRFQGRIPNLLNNLLRLEHLDWQSATDAIRKPLAEYNRRLPEGQTEVQIEDELVEAILKGVQTGKVKLETVGHGEVLKKGETEKNNVQIETPFLQIVLTRLWEEERASGSQVLRLATLERLGGPENIARTHLDKQMQTLSPSERVIASHLFRYLVTPSGTKIAQESVALAAWTNLDEKVVHSLLLRLSSPEMRILRTVAAPGQPERYEMFHDVLARGVLNWQARRRIVRERARVKRWRVGVGLLALLLAVVVLVWFFMNKTWKNQIRADEANNLAESASGEFADPELELLLAVEAVKIMPTAYAQKELEKALASPMYAMLNGHNGPVRSVGFSPDGQYLASAGEDSRVLVTSVDNLYDTTALKHDNFVMSATFSPDSKLLATGCKNGSVRVYAVGKWKTPTEWQGHEKSVRSVAFSPDGNWLITGSEDNTARIWHQIGDGKWSQLTTLRDPSLRDSCVTQTNAAAKQELPSHKGFVQTATFSHDGRFVLTASRDQTAKIWKAGTWELIQTLGDNNVVRGAVFSPDDQLIVTGNESCQAKIWKRTGERWGKQDGAKWLPDQTLQNPEGCAERTSRDYQYGYIDAVNFSPDGKFLVTASRDHSVLIRETSTWKNVVMMDGHGGEVYSAAYSPDGRFVISASEDARVILWEPRMAHAPPNTSIDKLLKMAEPRLLRPLMCNELNRFQLSCDKSPTENCCSRSSHKKMP